MSSRPRHPARTVLLGVLSAFGPLSMDMYLPALPEVASQLHTTSAAGQLTITSCIFGLAAGQIIVGPLSDRWGRKLPLLAGVGLFTLTSFLIPFTTSIWPLIILRLFQGIGGSAGQVLSRAVARDLFSGPQLGRFLGILMSINGIFPIIAPLLGGAVLSFTDWRGVFVILGAIGLILFLWTWWGLPETLPADRRTATGFAAFTQMSELFKDRPFMGYMLSQGFVYGALYVYISGSAFAFETVFHFSPQVFSIIYAINGAGMIVATQFAARGLNDQNGRKILGGSILTAAIASTLLLFGISQWPSGLLLAGGLVIIISLVGAVNTTATTLALGNEAQHAGAASALLGLGMNAIGGLMSPVVGLFGTRSSLPMVALIMVCEWIAFLLLVGLTRKTIR
ncbi:multidrug effflux MFS transporter [Schleiferilactobacillus harbinensis]|jgi:DHA1 family bicyclomycin/chloramphenicol resistance-like MFS transporter|uniref:Bcr/CflA family efflux transporter n=1 Tax=Schleiferilactobacillus harbinensis TaxID=304207 RepID=A0A5P2TXH4_9LACO|nr:multidrug effflux MFS transporter [Schleiferilactobacillus harbinensis]MCI1686709.1 multidrug effflux MFS transporter [Schleiferilactobacillus harbinensis]MCI1784491.1 multidrug effflux MFS transporter [Schleiferilactobacillus harbinensis]MCI1849329.1 multidrug effflux MFS transporter [Schleiferilactobacillus harbinensis]QEU48053.1 multidrug effflux MFS transporter [Schleiferilactobacillus harbinensis]QFR25089.1 Bcr/CflA family efflux MFS transporter [Schleiferilactobacillus harbinensis]